jgi:hypothetical protein
MLLVTEHWTMRIVKEHSLEINAIRNENQGPAFRVQLKDAKYKIIRRPTGSRGSPPTIAASFSTVTAQ